MAGVVHLVVYNDRPDFTVYAAFTDEDKANEYAEKHSRKHQELEVVQLPLNPTKNMYGVQFDTDLGVRVFRSQHGIKDNENPRHTAAFLTYYTEADNDEHAIALAREATRDFKINQEGEWVRD